jgi:DNA-binding response OmpR family regulator
MRQVLLLEPDRLLAASIKCYFAKAGYSVSAHSDPQAAISQTDKQVPDAVITELQLANRSGVEFLYEFRSYPEWQNIPVIVFTNLSGEQLAAYGKIFKELNVTACLYKSAASLQQLLNSIQKSHSILVK